MNAATNIEAPVSSAEQERRIAEYRRVSFERDAPPQVVYHDPYVSCPWPDCTWRIDGIHFQLDEWADPSRRELYQEAWWQGRGLVGRCPGCGKYVLFSVSGKAAVDDVCGLIVLPDDWHGHAHVVTKT